MGIDSTDDIDGIVAWGDAISEKKESASEKSKSKKAERFIQKAQKDERRARSDNDDLFLILAKFLKNHFFDELFQPITSLLERAFPSRVILGLVAFVYPEATLYMSLHLHKEEMMNSLKKLSRNQTMVPFNENSLDESIRNWMSLWITTWYDFVLHQDASIIMNHKLFSLLKSEESKNILTLWVISVLIFFFQTRNISITQSVARRYADFIVSQLLEKVEHLSNKHLADDPEFLLDQSEGSTVTASMLFGFAASEP